MGGNASNAEPHDPRWVAVEDRDQFGRTYYRWLPRNGARFGSLVVQGNNGVSGEKGQAYTLCDCGQQTTLNMRGLRRGVIRCKRCTHDTCGARSSIGAGIIASKSVRAMWLHRRTGAISRCTDPDHKAWTNYGGRGITVYKPWVDDRLEWLRYAVTLHGWDNRKLDLDRIDNNKGYEPGNLRLVSRSENASNKRNTVYLIVEGNRVSFSEFRARYCPEWRSYNAITHHLKQGKTGDEIAAYYRATRGSL